MTITDRIYVGVIHDVLAVHSRSVRLFRKELPYTFI
jgi:hypothetical protein